MMNLNSKPAEGIIQTDDTDLSQCMFIELNGTQQHWLMTRASNEDVKNFYQANRARI